MAVSPDGASVYVASYTSRAVSVFTREAAPVCTATGASTAPRKKVSLKLRCADADGQPVSLAIVSGPKHGKLGPINQTTGKVTYTPAKNFQGFDGFTFTASDGTNFAVPAPAFIIVAPRFVLVGKPKQSGKKLSFVLKCQALPKKVCHGRAQLTTLNRHHKRVTIGSIHFKIKAGHHKKLVIKLNKTGRQLLASIGPLNATLTITILNTKPPTSFTVKTKIKKK